MTHRLIGTAVRQMPGKVKSLLNRTLICASRRFKSYEGDGKTYVKILNTDPDAGLLIDSYSQVGFRLNNGIMVVGAMIIFPKTVLSWSISSVEEVNEDSLSLLHYLEPKMDIVVLGTGDEYAHAIFRKDAIRSLLLHRISIEAAPTEQACATYNFLVAEKRSVVGCFIPPSTLRPTESDVVASKFRKNELYNSDLY